MHTAVPELLIVIIKCYVLCATVLVKLLYNWQQRCLHKVKKAKDIFSISRTMF